MRGDIKLFMLEFIQATAMTTAEILDELAYYSKSNWYARFRKLPRKMQKYKPLFEKQINALKERQRISKLIFELKKDKLVEYGKNGDALVVTYRGDLEIKNKLSRRLPESEYAILPTNEWKIIAFDIPEFYKRQRKWLRFALKKFGFQMFQKSVWIGKNAIPEEFIYDLREQGIGDFVHILAVTKKGTLRQIE